MIPTLLIEKRLFRLQQQNTYAIVRLGTPDSGDTWFAMEAQIAWRGDQRLRLMQMEKDNPFPIHQSRIFLFRLINAQFTWLDLTECTALEETHPLLLVSTAKLSRMVIRALRAEFPKAADTLNGGSDHV